MCMKPSYLLSFLESKTGLKALKIKARVSRLDERKETSFVMNEATPGQNLLLATYFLGFSSTELPGKLPGL